MFYNEYDNEYNGNFYHNNEVASKSHVTKFFILMIIILIIYSVKHEMAEDNSTKYTFQDNGKTYEIIIKEKNTTFIETILE